MVLLDLHAVTEVKYALDDLHGYLTDNSCGDPDCCGGPFYDEEQFEEAKNVLFKYGIEYLEQNKEQ